MPFTDADGNPITCHTCPFKINTDCTAMPPTPSTNALTMQVWNYPPARNPCIRHPALGGMKLPEGVTAVLDIPVVDVPSMGIVDDLIPPVSAEVITSTNVEAGDPVYISPADEVQAEPDPDPGIAGNVPDKPPTRSRASRATARPAE